MALNTAAQPIYKLMQRLMGMGFVLAALAILVVMFTNAGSTSQTVRLNGHVPQQSIRLSKFAGPTDPTAVMTLEFPLKLKYSEDLDTFIQRVHTPGDALYGHYLTSSQFAKIYGSNAQDCQAVSGAIESLGLKVTGTTPNCTAINAQGTVGQIEDALQTHISNFIGPDGRKHFAATVEPQLPGVLADQVVGVLGLHNFTRRKHHAKRGTRSSQSTNPGSTGPNGSGLAPVDIRKAYNLTQTGMTGSGQTIALLEWDGYTPSDIATYFQTFGMTAPTITNVAVDGTLQSNMTPSSGSDSGAIEVELDIELAGALAPGATVMVYMGPKTASEVAEFTTTLTASEDQQSLDTITQVATDNLATVVSMSWGVDENQVSQAFMTSESNVFKQMAAQGQTVFIADGDTGAYMAYYGQLSVGDPAGPYVTLVGGTNLTTDSQGNYLSETTWNNVPASDQLSTAYNPLSWSAGSGGVSTVWSLPAWQVGLGTTANQGSTTHRMDPDVSLNADDVNSPYAIYAASLGGWIPVGGTSCAAPLWAAFIALVNEKRLANGMQNLGFANTAIYSIAQGSLYASTFHDVADNSNNLYYHAVSGYDMATGWGSFNGQSLFSALTSSVLPPSPPVGFAVEAVTTP